MASVLSSLRYLLADLIGDKNETLPVLPDGLPETVVGVADEAIRTLIDYQSTHYAQLYVDRLSRFVGRPGVDPAMFAEIARLMAARMELRGSHPDRAVEACRNASRWAAASGGIQEIPAG